MADTQNSDTTLWKGAIYPAVIVATTTCICVAIIKGRSGLFAGLLASFTIIIFFSIHLVVARISRNLEPMLTMALAMLSYFIKVILMALFLLLVSKYAENGTVDRTSFAFCAILIIIAWLFGEIRSFLKLRLQLPLPNKKELSDDS